jgi:hypothetical protein
MARSAVCWSTNRLRPGVGPVRLELGTGVDVEHVSQAGTLERAAAADHAPGAIEVGQQLESAAPVVAFGALRGAVLVGETLPLGEVLVELGVGE